ncbi:MAG: glycosyltransferase family 2 protein [Clostridiales bacterium]|nr:glycosyltransferase family 2 protein [Clostridiales bacterium]
MSPTVSIIMPAKNSGAYLTRCIDSVLSQKYTDWELLIIDDGSTDDTRDIAYSFSQSDKRIRVFDSKGTGVSSARNSGIELSSGEYISFIDSDDRVDPDYLSELVELAEKENADISQCSLYYWYDNGSLIQEKETVTAVYSGRDEIMNAYFSGMVGKICLAAWAKLFKREMLGDIRFDETLTIQEDAFLTFQCCMKASRIACSNKPLYYYYQNPGSVMSRAFDGSKMQYFTVLDRELDICKTDLSLAADIMRRKVITALDLTTQIIRDDSGHEYLDELKKFADETSDKIKGKLGFKTRVKLFVLRHFSALYYGLLKIKYK